MDRAELNDLLDKLQEECAEVIQIASKIKRFGIDSYHPDDPATTNQILLEREVGDTLALIGLLTTAGILNSARVQAHVPKKLAKLQKYPTVR